GFTTLYEFLDSLLKTKDQQLSSRMTKMISMHGPELLDSIRCRKPDVVDAWSWNNMATIVSQEGKKLAELLRPVPNEPISVLLERFDLGEVLLEAEKLAPCICSLLREAGIGKKEPSKRRDENLVFAMMICMLAQARSKRSNEFQTMMCIYLLANGASRSVFEVFHHAGVTSSYRKAIRDLKMISEECMKKIIEITKTHAFMVVWDNPNIAFHVAEQRTGSKDHFDNGTTATLIPLYGVEFGEFKLSMKQQRETWLPAVKFGLDDILPPLEQVKQIEAVQLWHIEDILFDFFPSLRRRLEDSIPAAPMVLPIPVHKTEQYPLPAMHIDESSLDGMVEVLETIVEKHLKMTAEDIEKHGVILCAGDQLSVSLLDKILASRHDDSKLCDNFGKWTEGQLGLFHVKMAGDRMIANEYWGKANSSSPWSLWKINALL
ncbi:hypothetical protein JAAARDRAFT_107360, partial [Jaapia argillacea MUCL 33604]